MTDAERAAQEIFEWSASEECQDILESDLAFCDHEKALRTTAEAHALCIKRIRQIIDKNMC